MDQSQFATLMSQLGEIRASVGGVSAAWAAVLASLITGSLTFAGAVVAPIYADRGRRRREALAFRAALVADITTYIEIMESRGYLDDLRTGPTPDGPGLEVRMPPDLFFVFKSNSSKIGLLASDDATDVVLFYHLLEGVALDVSPGGILSMAARGEIKGPQVERTFQQDAVSLEQAMAAGRRFIER
ncbi:hypothetical protein [Salinicola sp. RZ23]|uniref:hypothetical protein n=1 Tax=Salinicola sp. RZ23 TaxID=1949087 RepID=UPI000DA10DE6|nr:hypothetical protein [Salinicola sp. RZ23]